MATNHILSPFSTVLQRSEFTESAHNTSCCQRAHLIPIPSGHPVSPSHCESPRLTEPASPCASPCQRLLRSVYRATRQPLRLKPGAHSAQHSYSTGQSVHSTDRQVHLKQKLYFWCVKKKKKKYKKLRLCQVCFVFIVTSSVWKQHAELRTSRGQAWAKAEINNYK